MVGPVELIPVRTYSLTRFASCNSLHSAHILELKALYSHSVALPDDYVYCPSNLVIFEEVRRLLLVGVELLEILARVSNSFDFFVPLELVQDHVFFGEDSDCGVIDWRPLCLCVGTMHFVLWKMMLHSIFGFWCLIVSICIWLELDAEVL
ncbi:hypothetical protein Tco_0491004 [Tanacetum coccineum]